MHRSPLDIAVQRMDRVGKGVVHALRTAGGRPHAPAAADEGMAPISYHTHSAPPSPFLAPPPRPNTPPHVFLVSWIFHLARSCIHDKVQSEYHRLSQIEWVFLVGLQTYYVLMI